MKPGQPQIVGFFMILFGLFCFIGLKANIFIRLIPSSIFIIIGAIFIYIGESQEIK